jgi:hypothetical protein
MWNKEAPQNDNTSSEGKGDDPFILMDLEKEEKGITKHLKKDKGLNSDLRFGVDLPRKHSKGICEKNGSIQMVVGIYISVTEVT